MLGEASEKLVAEGFNSYFVRNVRKADSLTQTEVGPNQKCLERAAKDLVECVRSSILLSLLVGVNQTLLRSSNHGGRDLKEKRRESK